MDDKSCIDFIKALNPSTYQFTDNTSNRRHTGFLEQQTEQVIRDTVGDCGLFKNYYIHEFMA